MIRDTRQRLLTTSARLLQRQGFHGTGLNQIVAEAGAPKGSLYFHFPGGKDQLTAEAIGLAGSSVDAALARHQDTTARRALDSYLAEVATLLERTEFREGCPIATVALEVGCSSTEIGDACAAAYDRLIERVAEWVEADGVDPEDARETAFLVYAAIEGALVFAKAQRSVQPITRLRARLATLVGTAGDERRAG